MVGADQAIRKLGDHILTSKWDLLKHAEIRSMMNRLRNLGLKERRDPAPFQVIFDGDGGFAMGRLLAGTPPGTPAFGTCEDYLRWIKTAAFPLVLEAIDRGSRGPAPIDDSLAIEDQMPFPDVDPWTARDEPEFEALMTHLQR